MTVVIVAPTPFAHDRLLVSIGERAHAYATRVVELLDPGTPDPAVVQAAIAELGSWFATYRAAHEGAAGSRLTVPRAMAQEIAGLGIEMTRTKISDGVCDFLEEGEALVFFCNVDSMAAQVAA